MGRTFENRKHAIMKRGARDNKAFTRCGRQISMAVKSAGGEPDSNPALRRAIQNARAANMPKDKIQNAIDKALKIGDTSGFEQMIYEGYGPHGVPMIVDTATDNPTRTVANVRSAFKKENGNLGNAGSVSFMFEQFGVFRLKPEGLSATNLSWNSLILDLKNLMTAPTTMANLCCSCVVHETISERFKMLEERKIQVDSSGFEWIPKTMTELSDEEVDAVLKLVDRLEEDDDVQAVFHNLA